MGDPSHFGERVPEAARFLVSRLGRPDVGIVLGSGFEPLAGALGAGGRVGAAEVPGLPGVAGGGTRGWAAATIAGRAVWTVIGRLHLYEGLDATAVAVPIAVLAAAGARAVLLTCAAGGLLETDQPGDFALVADQINLTGADPLRRIGPDRRDPAFLDLQDAYDPALRAAWVGAAEGSGATLRSGVLAAVTGPCYESPAEVRMLRSIGADLVSMSVAPETIAARYLGLRVAALACVANTGAGMPGAGTIGHDRVLAVVRESVSANASMLLAGADRMVAAVGPR